MNIYLEGAIRYPAELPCPQIETDLTPRERRYISDIGQVKMLRRFQRVYQATRQNISFVFNPTQARDFQAWYKDEICDGGAWFYADWPILHKEADIAYRFVTRPVWRVLALGNFHVSASVELYEGRKVGRYLNVFTSKIYPHYFKDSIIRIGFTTDAYPYARFDDNVMRRGFILTQGSLKKWIYSSYTLQDEAVQRVGFTILSGSVKRWIYSSYALQDESVQREGHTISRGSMVVQGRIFYDYFEDSVIRSGFTILSGEKI